VRVIFPLAGNYSAPNPSFLQELLGGLFAAVFPTDCILCQQELTEPGGASICRACWGSLQPWFGPSCEHCGLPFGSWQAADSVEPLCSPCRRGEQKFDVARSFGIYTGNLRKAILHLKFHRREYLGDRLGALMARAWEALPELDQPLVAPVPLHSSRKRQRGFDQAELLAKGLVRRLRKEGGSRGLQLAPGVVVRVRPTLPQVGLSASARRENVSGVFSVLWPQLVRNRTVVLVDDVMTTGATLSACAAAVKQAGASRVLALSLARATPRFPDVGSNG